MSAVVSVSLSLSLSCSLSLRRLAGLEGSFLNKLDIRFCDIALNR